MDEKLRRLNRLRPKFCLESDSNCLLINIFDPNLSSESKSSWQNWFHRLRIPSKSSKLIEKEIKKRSKRDQKEIWFIRIKSKKSKDFIHLFQSFNQKLVNFNQKWWNLIKKRSKIDWIPNPQYDFDIGLPIVAISPSEFGWLGIGIVEDSIPEP